MDVLESNTLDINFETLGEFIRFHREKKLISLEELSMKTKIRIQQLVNLEQNNFIELPNAVYLKGFIKSICNELDINVDLALIYLNDNKIAETAIENALEFLTPGKEIKRLPFDFKFFNRSKIKVNQKLLVICVVAIALGGSFVGNVRMDKRKSAPAIIHKKMNFIEESKLIQTDAVTNLLPPEGIGQSAPKRAKGEIISMRKTVLSNDLLEGRRIISDDESKAATAPAQVPAASLAPAIETSVPQAGTAAVTAQETKLTIRAKSGTAFLVYRVNGEKKKKIYLRRGKTLDLFGREIRMDVGNPGAVEFTKNDEPFAVKAGPGQATLRLEF